MNKFYIRNEEDDPMTTQQQINSDFDAEKTKDRGRWAVLALLFLAVVLAFCGTIAHAQAVNTATITFQGSTTYTDGTAYPAGATVVYDLYQAVKGAPKVKVGTIASGGQINTGLLTGIEYCWDVVTVVKVGTAPAAQSDHSTEACKNFAGKPGVVTITVT
jgi:hypothetical protein